MARRSLPIVKRINSKPSLTPKLIVVNMIPVFQIKHDKLRPLIAVYMRTWLPTSCRDGCRDLRRLSNRRSGSLYYSCNSQGCMVILLPFMIFTGYYMSLAILGIVESRHLLEEVSMNLPKCATLSTLALLLGDTIVSKKHAVLKVPSAKPHEGKRRLKNRSLASERRSGDVGIHTCQGRPQER